MMLERAPRGDVRRAADFFKLIRYSFSGGAKSFAGKSCDIRRFFYLIWECSRRLANVVIENKDYGEIVQQYDRPDAFLYDANTGEAVGEEKELPPTVTLLVTTEQAKVLAGLEQESELHLALVYRGTAENASAFIEAQDALIEELYAEPEAEETAEATENTETGESEGADPAAESEAAAE